MVLKRKRHTTNVLPSKDGNQNWIHDERYILMIGRQAEPFWCRGQSEKMETRRSRSGMNDAMQSIAYRQYTYLF